MPGSFSSRPTAPSAAASTSVRAALTPQRPSTPPLYSHTTPTQPPTYRRRQPPHCSLSAQEPAPPCSPAAATSLGTRSRCSTTWTEMARPPAHRCILPSSARLCPPLCPPLPSSARLCPPLCPPLPSSALPSSTDGSLAPPRRHARAGCWCRGQRGQCRIRKFKVRRRGIHFAPRQRRRCGRCQGLDSVARSQRNCVRVRRGGRSPVGARRCRPPHATFPPPSRLR